MRLSIFLGSAVSCILALVQGLCSALNDPSPQAASCLSEPPALPDALLHVVQDLLRRAPGEVVQLQRVELADSSGEPRAG